MFDIRPDPVRPLLHVRLSGFWSTDTVDEYGAALGQALVARAGEGRFGLLIDARGYPVQSGEVATRFGEMLSRWPPSGPDRPLAGVAIVTGNALGKIQAQRTFGTAATVFLDPGAATVWLGDVV